MLSVEDDTRLGELLRDDFRERYATDWAQDGDEVIELLAHFPYDLVMLDLTLPSPDGFEIVSHVRISGKHLPALS